MEPLIEYAHLFANGKFRVLTGLEDDLVCEIHAYDWNSSEFMIYSREDEIDTWHSIEDCTLIARPIEDMTDEERNTWKSKKTYRAHADDYVPSPRSFIYALSVGCLPEIWNHCFEDGTVININEV